MKEIELYIHIPFCERKCLYCDFVSFHADYNMINQYVSVLLSEIENKAYVANDYEVRSIYIGGGTPSFIDAKYIGFILESIRKHYHLKEDCEISIEANPNSATKEKFEAYINYGINRLSIGLQSANDNELKTLGRIHDYSDFIYAYDNAIHIGFKNINIDLINGIPGQTPESYKKTLKSVLLLNPKHVSIYNLILEENTAFFKMHKEGNISLPDENTMIEIDNITRELTDYYRLKRYEISNYAKSGFECKHNLGYWEMVPYIGFGLNSSSYINNKRYKNRKNFNEYLKLNFNIYLTNESKIDYYDEVQILDKLDMMSEYVMLGFRKIDGIDTEKFKTIFSEKFTDVFYEPLKKYHELGYIIKKEQNYALSYDGLNISNKILSEFLLK